MLLALVGCSGGGAEREASAGTRSQASAETPNDSKADPGGEPAPWQAALSAWPSKPAADRGLIPHFVIWPLIADPSDEQMKAEGNYLRLVLMSAMASDPQPVLRIFDRGFEGTLLPGEDSIHHRPIESYTAGELADRALAFGARTSLLMRIERTAEGTPRLRFEAIGAETRSVVLSREVEGTWERIDQRMGPVLLEIVELATEGNVTPEMAAYFGASVLGDSKMFLELQRQTTREPRDLAASALAFREWADANPTVPFLRSWAVANELYFGENPEQTLVRIVEELGEEEPFDAATALALANWAWAEHEDQEAPRALYERLAAMYPGWQTPMEKLINYHRDRGEVDEGLQWVEPALRIHAGNWMVFAAQGLLHETRANEIQGDSAAGSVPPEQMTDYSRDRRMAIESFRRAAELNPFGAFEQTRLGAAELRGGSVHLAERHLLKARELMLGSQDTLPFLFWLYTPSYSNRRVEGLKLFREEAPLKEPKAARDSVKAILQILTNDPGSPHSKLLAHGAAHHWDILLLARLNLIGISDLEHRSPTEQDAFSLNWAAWLYEVFAIEARETEVHVMRTAMEKVDFGADVPNRTATWQTIAAQMVRHGMLDEAERIFRMAMDRGEGDDALQRAGGGLFLVQAKRGDVGGALAGLDSMRAPYWVTEEFKIECLLLGTSEDRQEALKRAREYHKHVERPAVVQALIKALIANGQWEEARSTIRTEYRLQVRLVPPADRYWEEVARQLGQSPEWPPVKAGNHGP
ncbi:MAG: hypothetical protein RLY93_13875 [Sumerlaeia bacterium]